MTLKNSLKLEKLSLAPLQVQHLAVGMDLAKLQYAFQASADEDAPHFDKGSEPLQDGRAYRSTAGAMYYRPELRIAQRAVDPKGPDVRFLKDAEGHVWLHFTLEEAPPGNLAVQAEPFNVRVEQLHLEWRDASGQPRRRLFDQPTLVATEDPPLSAEPNFEIRVGAKLAPEEVEELFSALRRPESTARLVAKLSYGYWVDEAPGQGPAGPSPAGSSQRPESSSPASPGSPIDRIAPVVPVMPVTSVRPATPGNSGASNASSSPGTPGTQGTAGATAVPGALGASPTSSAPAAARLSSASLSRLVGMIPLRAAAPANQPAAGNPAPAPAVQPSQPTPASPAAQPSLVRSASLLSVRYTPAPVAASAMVKRLNQPLNATLVSKILADAKERERRPDFRRVTIERSIPFTFNPDLAQNRPIYAAILGGETLGDTWVNTSFGWIRSAPFPNTVYRLPDEVRLAYNPDLGLPHMMATLYEDDDGEVRVRVVLGAAPWHDPKRLIELRDFLYESTAGALASPAVVVGGYESAKLRLTSAFPEEIRLLSGDEATVSLDGGFTLTLDLSLEFYKFLCELLTSSHGLTGEVTVTLETSAPRDENAASGVTFSGVAPSGSGAAGDVTAGTGSPSGPSSQGAAKAVQRIQRIVPVRLNLSDLAGLPLDVQVEKDAVSPTRVEVRNLARSSVRVAGCAVRLLQYDPNSVVPISVMKASPQADFPLEIGEQSAVTLSLQPEKNSTDLLWNAVAVELFGQDLSETPVQVLERVHAVAASSTLTWVVTVECPVFLAAPVPDRYANLYKVEVQISGPGYAAQQVVLGRDAARGSITMQRTLRDLLSAEAGSIGSFTYRVRNIYFDRQGAWSEPREAEGSSLFVFPNPVEHD